MMRAALRRLATSPAAWRTSAALAAVTWGLATLTAVHEELAAGIAAMAAQLGEHEHQEHEHQDEEA